MNRPDIENYLAKVSEPARMQQMINRLTEQNVALLGRIEHERITKWAIYALGFASGFIALAVIAGVISVLGGGR